jgi:plasmid stabilization system protein ParE
MNQYKVLLSDAAAKDLHEIFDYIALELRSAQSASRTLDLLEDAIKKLDTAPKLHSLVRDDYLASLGYRFKPVKNYNVFFLVDDHNMAVAVVRILYGRRDWSLVLSNQ